MIEGQNLDGIPDSLASPVLHGVIGFCLLFYAPLHYIYIGGESALWYLAQTAVPLAVMAWSVWRILSGGGAPQ